MGSQKWRRQMSKLRRDTKRTKATRDFTELLERGKQYASDEPLKYVVVEQVTLDDVLIGNLSPNQVVKFLKEN